MKRESFNGGWIFYTKENPEEKTAVRLPHDAMQYEERIPKLKNGPLVAFYPGGDYYYEKEFYGDPSYEDQTVMLDFGGIFMDSHVYLNGEEVGGHVYGYSNFYVDLTDKLRIGERNLLKVYVHNSQTPNSRWYSGSGIYRPVYLISGDREHIRPDGVKVITKEYDPALLEVSVEHTGREDVQVLTEILWANLTVASGHGAVCEIPVPDAKLWDAEHPNLYTVRVSLMRKDKVIDVQEQRFGIRKIQWDASYGLKINGQVVKLRGACIHHDNGILGAAEYKEAALRRIRRLKEGGFNAIRGAHDPRSREVLEACDEIGMYVMEESFDVWYGSAGVYGYTLYFREEWEKDLELMIRKCFNHPSVIMYSIGNEISETCTEEGIWYGHEMTQLCHKLDDSRPVTLGVNLMLNILAAQGKGMDAYGGSVMNKADVVDPKACEPDSDQNGSVLVNNMVADFADYMKNVNKPENTDGPTKGIFVELDIAGYNYGETSYEKHHEWYPDRIMVGTETNLMNMKERIEMVRNQPYIIGDFIWTGWEYLGECGVGVIDYNENAGNYNKPYPCIVAGCGLYDLIGHRDTLEYDLMIAWGVRDKPHIAVSHPKHAQDEMIPGLYRSTDAIDSWSFEGYEGIETRVRVASPGKEVELFVNGKSMGVKPLEDLYAEYLVIYEAGILEVVAYDENRNEIGRDRLVSASNETVISVRTEKETMDVGGDDIVYLDVEITDENGICKPEERVVKVKVQGAGTLLAVGSGAHRTEEKYIGDSFTTCNGRMAAVIRSAEEVGDIYVTFSSDGLPDKTIKLEVR